MPRPHRNSFIDCEKSKARGLKHYYDSEPCLRGHIGLHYVSNGTCIKCQYDDNVRNAEAKKKAKLRNRVIPGARVFIQGQEVKNAK